MININKKERSISATVVAGEGECTVAPQDRTNPVCVILDSEFSEFQQPDLLSLGFVARDSDDELYIVLTDGWSMDRCSEFVRREVIPLLTHHNPEYLTMAQAVPRIEVFFDRLRGGNRDRPILVCSDSLFDWDLLVGLDCGAPSEASWPARFNMAGRLIQWDLEVGAQMAAFSEEVSLYFQRLNNAGVHERHNALVDARSIKHAYWETRFV